MVLLSVPVLKLSLSLSLSLFLTHTHAHTHTHPHTHPHTHTRVRARPHTQTHTHTPTRAPAPGAKPAPHPRLQWPPVSAQEHNTAPVQILLVSPLKPPELCFVGHCAYGLDLLGIIFVFSPLFPLCPPVL